MITESVSRPPNETKKNAGLFLYDDGRLLVVNK